MKQRNRITTRKLLQMKKKQEPIAMITAYDFPTAEIVERAGVDIVLVGDSLGMVVLGYESTIYVTLEDMLHHTKAVSRGVKDAMVISDIPFSIPHFSSDIVLQAATKLMQEGKAYGVKIEGGAEVKDSIKVLTGAGVPVMGHLGLTPQSINQLGGYLIQGKNKVAAKALVEDAKLLENAGVFSLVLECVPEELAQIIAEELKIPVIGIGAGRFCDGQVLVFHDLLGIGGDSYPSFVKTYSSLQTEMHKGVGTYVQEVKNGLFPLENHSSHLPEEIIRFLKDEEGGGVPLKLSKQ